MNGSFAVVFSNVGSGPGAAVGQDYPIAAVDLTTRRLAVQTALSNFRCLPTSKL